MAGDWSDHSSQQHLTQAEAALPLDIPVEIDAVAELHPSRPAGTV
jgi:hypothetical protein